MNVFNIIVYFLLKIDPSLSAFNNNFQINNDIAAEFLCAAEIPTLPLPDHHAVTAVMQAVTAVTLPPDGVGPGQSDQEGGLREQRGVHNTHRHHHYHHHYYHHY